MFSKINYKYIFFTTIIFSAFVVISLFYNIQGNFDVLRNDLSALLNQHLVLDLIEEPQSLDAIKNVLEKEQPNIPYRYWLDDDGPRAKSFREHNNNSCAVFPDLFLNTKFHNIHWQTFENGNIVFQLYSSYYDNRDKVVKRPVIRMLILSNQVIGPFPRSYCQFWYRSNEITNGNMKVMPLDEIALLWHWSWPKKTNSFYPYLLTCVIPDENIIPQAVSLITDYCSNATNSLRVIYEPKQAKKPENLAMCIHNFNINTEYNDKWIEVQRSLGVNKIFIYTYEHNANINKILQYHKTQGIVNITSFSFGNTLPITSFFTNHVLKHLPSIRIAQEIIAYNDCFYKHMYQYNYIIMLDSYDVLTSLGKVQNWLSIFQNLTYINQYTQKDCDSNSISICFSDYHYLPQNFNMSFNQSLFDVISSYYNYNFRIIKCFYNTKSVIIVHNNLLLNNKQDCNNYILPSTIAKIQNFKDLEEKEMLIVN